MLSQHVQYTDIRSCHSPLKQLDCSCSKISDTGNHILFIAFAYMLCAPYSNIIRAGILDPFEYAVLTGLRLSPLQKYRKTKRCKTT